MPSKAKPKVPPVSLEAVDVPRIRTKMTDRDEAEIVKAMRRHDVTTSSSHDGLTSRRGIVERPGRRLKDGSLQGGGPARKLTLYVKPETGLAFEMLALQIGKSLSDLADEALAFFVEAKGRKP